MKKGFEIGKVYQHHSGQQIFICGIADTILYGKCFIAEKGWNKEILKILKYNYEHPKDKDSKLPNVKPGDEGWNIFEPISMDKESTDNWFEITKEEFISNNYSK